MDFPYDNDNDDKDEDEVTSPFKHSHLYPAGCTLSISFLYFFNNKPIMFILTRENDM